MGDEGRGNLGKQEVEVRVEETWENAGGSTRDRKCRFAGGMPRGLPKAHHTHGSNRQHAINPDTGHTSLCI